MNARHGQRKTFITLHETHFLGHCKSCQHYWGYSKGDWIHKGLCWHRPFGEILHHLLGYYPDIHEFYWKLDWTRDPDWRSGDGYRSCSVCAQPEQLVVWASLVQVEATSHSSASSSLAVPERCAEISRLLSSRSCPSNISIRFTYLVQPVQMNHGTISYLVSVSKILSHERLKLRIVRTVYPLV